MMISRLEGKGTALRRQQAAPREPLRPLFADHAQTEVTCAVPWIRTGDDGGGRTSGCLAQTRQLGSANDSGPSKASKVQLVASACIKVRAYDKCKAGSLLPSR